MKRKCLAVGIILLFVGTCIIPATAQDIEKSSKTSSRGHWLYVGGSGPGNYSTIQRAINAANPGDTVFVYNGTYYENIIVNKTINLLGENKNTTIIDGGGITDVVLICADQANISRFTIQNSGNDRWNAGINIHANYTYVFDNSVTNHNKLGIVIGTEEKHLYHHNIINKNLVSKNWDTNIWIEESDYNDITNNIIFQDLNRDCICTRYSNHCKIENNTLLDSPYGISLFWGSYATVTNNFIKNCSIMGIYLNGQHHNLIGFNSIENCNYDSIMGMGIRLESQSNNNTIINNYVNYTISAGISLYSSSNNNIIRGNTIKNCHCYGISNGCDNNKFYHNNFFRNVPQNAYDPGNTPWDNGYPCSGNYWDEYLGTDNYCGVGQNEIGSDGVGDTPYNVSGGNNQDQYPLMSPYGITKLAITIHLTLFRLSMTIKNVGNTTAFNVQWSNVLEGRFIILGNDSSGEIPKPLLPNQEIRVSSKFFLLGFGKIEMTFTAWADNCPIVSTKINGILLLFFFFIR